jgi:polygalacturonase
MSTQNNFRREFLKRAGAGLPGAALLFQTGQGGARAAEAGPGPGLFNVKAFGASGGGAALDTAAVNKAIQAAAAAGGGTVFFPAGSYLCYSIHLMSDVALYLDMGATIVAADSPAEGASGTGAYDLAEPNEWSQYQDYGHSHFRNSLLWGEGLKNVSISGPGRIWGKGLSRGAGGAPRAEQAGVGNKSISLKNCHNVLLRDFSILHGGHFCLLATGVDNLTIDNIMLDTNRDGFDIDCCRNVRVSNCVVNSPLDDAIVLKSSYGLGSAKPTEFVTITNCYVAGCFEEGTLLDGTYKRNGRGGTGRIKFGTESNGGFRNITVSNCVFEGCQGLALETVDGALLEDVTITNISMRDIISAPIFLRLGRRMRGPKEIPIGTLKRVIIDNLVCSNCVPRQGSIISGIPDHYIENVKSATCRSSTRGERARKPPPSSRPRTKPRIPSPPCSAPCPRTASTSGMSRGSS